jgi:hypothetical protein
MCCGIQQHVCQCQYVKPQRHTAARLSVSICHTAKAYSSTCVSVNMSYRKGIQQHVCHCQYVIPQRHTAARVSLSICHTAKAQNLPTNNQIPLQSDLSLTNTYKLQAVCCTETNWQARSNYSHCYCHVTAVRRRYVGRDVLSSTPGTGRNFPPPKLPDWLRGPPSLFIQRVPGVPSRSKAAGAWSWQLSLI